MNSRHFQLSNAAFVSHPTLLGRFLRAQSRYLIAKPRICIEAKLCLEIDYEDIIYDFAVAKTRKVIM